MINELSSSTNTMNKRENKSLSLILSLRINDQLLIQNQTIDEYQLNSRVLSNSDQETSINERQSKTIQTKSDLMKPPRPPKSISMTYNSSKLASTEYNNSADDTFFEEPEQCSIESSGINRINSSNKINDKAKSSEITTTCVPSLTLSFSRNPYTLYKFPTINGHLPSINETTIDEEHPSNLPDISSSINQLNYEAPETSHTIPSLISKILKNHCTSQISSEPSTSKSNHYLSPIKTLKILLFLICSIEFDRR